MTKIIVSEIKSCSQCPHHHATPYPTSDSFERPEYWWCKHPENKEVAAPNQEAERARQQIIQGQAKNLRYVAGYVEWTDKTPIPKWCLLEDKKKPEWKEYDNPVRGDMDPQSWGDDIPEPRREMGG